MHVRCPHCSNPIELVDEGSLDDVSCPSCGSSFSLVGDGETQTFCPDTVESIGHFTLGERLGMGAFGAVWKAHDTELDRTIAIKIPRRGQLNYEETEKFLREARAAAQLRHPGIVPVHEVGRENDTVYIVSDFVDGLTLTDWLTGQRATTAEAARLCVQIAEALHHAHEKGVIHRDLKPGNIMLDREGDPHIMDFGLAKREAGEITMTADGQILGTPAYMSPEQAKGEGHYVDRRADVYSLGVILFELLTGERPFRGNTRMLIHQLLTEEPPSPRKLNAAIPRDLETICIKCLEKDPDRRYQTAASLQEDLQNYLDDKPIAARPINRFQRTWRWCKRRPLVAGLSASLFLALTTGLVISTLLWLRAEENWDLAEQQRSKAEISAEQAAEQRAIALANLKEADAQRQEANAQRKQADAQRADAEASFAIALDAVERMLYRVGNTKLEDVPQMEGVQAELLEEAESFFEKLMVRNSTNPVLRKRAGKAHWALADFCQRGHRYQRAEQAYLAAIAQFEQLVEEFPDEPEYRSDLAATCSNLCVLYDDKLHNPEASKKLLDRSLAIREQLAAENPDDDDYQHDLGFSYQVRANWLRDNDRGDEAEEAFQKAIAIRTRLVEKSPKKKSYNAELARCYGSLGWFYSRSDRSDEANEYFEKSLGIREELLQKYPRDRGLQDDFARALGSIGDNYYKRGKYDKALRQFNRAVKVWGKLAVDYPTWPAYRIGMSHNLRLRALTLVELKRFSDAVQDHLRAAEIWSSLDKEFPGQYRCEKGHQHMLAAEALAAEKDFEAARSHLLDAIGDLRAGLPNEDYYREFHVSKLHSSYEQLIEVLVRLNQIDAAIQAAGEWNLNASELTLDDRCEVAEKTVELMGKSRSWMERSQERNRLTTGLYQSALNGLQAASALSEAATREGREKIATTLRSDLGSALDRQGFLVKALQVRQRALLMYEQLRRDYPQVTDYTKYIAYSYDSDAICLKKLGRIAEAETAYLKSIEIVEQLLLENPDEAVHHQRNLGFIYTNYAILLNGEKRDEEAEAFEVKAIRVRQKLADEHPDDSKQLSPLANSLTTLGSRQEKQGRLVEAEANYRRSLAITEKLVRDHPDSKSYQRDLGYWYGNLGKLLQKTGRLPEAEAPLLKALRVREKLAEQDAPRIEDIRAVTFSQTDLGYHYFNRGMMPESAAQFQKAHELNTRLVADFPNVPEYQKSLGYSFVNLGTWSIRSKQWEDAQKQLLQAEEIFTKLMKDYPESAIYRRGYITSRTRRAWKLTLEGRGEDAVELYTALESNFPRSHDALSSYVWFLTVCPQLECRDSARAKQLADRMREIEPEDYKTWEAIGFAELRNENWEAAQEAFTKSLELRGTDSGYDLFPLSIATWRLGQNDVAIETFAKASQITAAAYPHDETLLMLHREAAVLMDQSTELPEPTWVFASETAVPEESEQSVPELLAVVKQMRDEADSLAEQDELDEAERVSAKAARLLKDRLVTAPDELRLRIQLMLVLHEVADIQKEASKWELADASFQRCIGLYESFATEYRLSPNMLYNLSLLYSRLSIVQRSRGQLGLARESQLKAIARQIEAFERKPDDKSNQLGLWNRYSSLAELDVELGDHHAAQQSVASMQPLRAGAYPLIHSARLMAQCVTIAQLDSRLSAQERRRVVAQYEQKSLRLLEQSLESGFKSFIAMELDPKFRSLRRNKEYQRLVAKYWGVEADKLIRGELDAGDRQGTDPEAAPAKTHRMSLEADTVYQIDLVATGFEPELKLGTVPADGKLKGFDQVSATHVRAMISVPEKGSCELVVSTLKPDQVGPYLLVVKPREDK